MITAAILIALATVLLMAWLKHESKNQTGNPKPVSPPWPQTSGAGRPNGMTIAKAIRAMFGLNNGGVYLANVGEPVSPGGIISRQAESGLVAQARYSIVKTGATDQYHADLCAAANMPLGVVLDEAVSANDWVAVQLLGAAQGTVRMIAAGAISIDTYVYTAASGQVQGTPANGTGTVYRIGIARKAASGANAVIEVECETPMAVTF